MPFSSNGGGLRIRYSAREGNRRKQIQTTKKGVRTLQKLNRNMVLKRSQLLQVFGQKIAYQDLLKPTQISYHSPVMNPAIV